MPRIEIDHITAKLHASHALNALEILRDCGQLDHDTHGNVTRMAEEMQDIWQALVREDEQ